MFEDLDEFARLGQGGRVDSARPLDIMEPSAAESAPSAVELETLAADETQGQLEAAPPYERGCLAWAKIHGFPWWPSQVR